MDDSYKLFLSEHKFEFSPNFQFSKNERIFDKDNVLYEKR